MEPVAEPRITQDSVALAQLSRHFSSALERLAEGCEWRYDLSRLSFRVGPFLGLLAVIWHDSRILTRIDLLVLAGSAVVGYLLVGLIGSVPLATWHGGKNKAVVTWFNATFPIGDPTRTLALFFIHEVRQLTNSALAGQGGDPVRSLLAHLFFATDDEWRLLHRQVLPRE